ncbi:GNAT family N-acetyltransferase [Clostridium frigidicarnis]|uniref:Acetyltransferase (GNAT) family protein n=1 Tax=Clostridium frigidicarnis TaxID=84698 RepID=A0A1I0XK18_9CLOT|nr:GNAT family N-acetyltransferase [Clostridium frigidicarnis]SFB00776.1 Acetyltransferase (GNAT) family protein [Clostridium frigidicarnis]
MVNKIELSEGIDKCAKVWGAAGAVAVYKNGKCYHKNFYGLADREKKLPITEKSTYLLSFNSRFLMGLCIGKLIDDKKLNLMDKLDKYIPEYTHASEITLKQLCLKQSGIPDFFNGGIMKVQQTDDAYQALSDQKRNLVDRKIFTHPWTFGDAIDYVNGKELTCIPGTEPTDDLDNMTETVFIREVIERASGKNLPNYVRTAIFAPLDISGEYLKVNTKPYAVHHMTIYMNSEYEADVKYTFAMNYAEAEKLLVTVLEKKLLSEKAWKAITTTATFEQSIAFNSVSGLLSARDFCYGNLGWSCYLYLDWEAKIGLLHLTNSELIVRCANGDRLSQFRKEFRKEATATFVYPKNTKLVPYGKTNLWDAMDLSIDDEQLEYMRNAQQAICIAYAYKQKLFVLMEGMRSIGLVAFKIDKKNENYYIESVLIDKKYQHRGFGKIMMMKGLEYLKSQGCKYLTIGVNRFNVTAQKLYKSVGFKEKTVYEDFIEMETYL